MSVTLSLFFCTLIFVELTFYQEALYREVQHIQAQDYQALASQHRQELEQLRRDVNIMGWFNRWLQRRSP